jgi:FkbM family methyltransferase
MMELKLKAIARRLVHPLRAPVSWAAQHGLLPPRVRKVAPRSWPFEPFTVYGPGWKFRWFPAKFDWIGREIFWTRFTEWEKETVPVLLEHVRRSRCFVDIGANCGIYTVMACTANPDLYVVAVEPVPKVSAALANNVRQNNLDRRVRLLNVALRDSSGTALFHEAQDATMSSLSVNGYGGQPGRLIEVECRTLDSVVDELQVEPDFLKIDVEGFEHAVLAGAGRTLSKLRPRIILEANPGDPSDRVTEILQKHRYTLHHITHAGLRRKEKIIPVEGEGYRNWLCLPEERGA